MIFTTLIVPTGQFRGNEEDIEKACKEDCPTGAYLHRGWQPYLTPSLITDTKFVVSEDPLAGNCEYVDATHTTSRRLFLFYLYGSSFQAH